MRLAPLLRALLAAAVLPVGGAHAHTVTHRPLPPPLPPSLALGPALQAGPPGLHAPPEHGPGAARARPGGMPIAAPYAALPPGTAPGGPRAAGPSGAGSAQGAAFEIARRGLPGGAAAARLAARAPAPALGRSLLFARTAPARPRAGIRPPVADTRLGTADLAAVGVSAAAALAGTVGLVLAPAPGWRRRGVRHRRGHGRGAARPMRRIRGLAQRLRRTVHRRSRRRRRISYLRFCMVAPRAAPAACRPALLPERDRPARAAPDRAAPDRQVHVRKSRVRRIAHRRRAAPRAA